jgi:hypothetical protein
MAQSLEAKLHEFAAGLTAEEMAQVRGFLMELDRGLTPTVRAKARQFVRNLTPDEAAQVAQVAQRAAADPALDGQADAQGYAAAAYEDEYGYKGRPGTNPMNAGGGSSADRWGFAVVIGSIGALLIGGILGGGDLDNL